MSSIVAKSTEDIRNTIISGPHLKMVNKQSYLFLWKWIILFIILLALIIIGIILYKKYTEKQQIYTKEESYHLNVR